MTPEPSEANLTKFLILERVAVNDAAPVEGDTPGEVVEIQVWKPIGAQLARDRDQAIRLFLGEPVREIAGVYCAVSENAWKPKNVSIKPAIRMSEAS